MCEVDLILYLASHHSKHHHFKVKLPHYSDMIQLGGMRVVRLTAVVAGHFYSQSHVRGHEVDIVRNVGVVVHLHVIVPASLEVNGLRYVDAVVLVVAVYERLGRELCRAKGIADAESNSFHGLHSEGVSA